MLCVVLFSAGCAKVSELEDKAYIQSAKIIDESITQGVVLASTPTTILIENDSVKVAVNIEYGFYISPISLNISLISNNTADRILGLTKDLDSSEEAPVYPITFQRNDEKIPFYIVAQSGMVTLGEIYLNFKDKSNEANITGFEIESLPNGVIVSQSPTIQSEGSDDGYIDIYHIKGTFPMTLKPTITLSEGAMIDAEKQGSPTVEEITFNKITGSSVIHVISASGKRRDWRINMRNGMELSDPMDFSVQQLSNMSISRNDVMPTIEGIVDPLITSVDSTNAVVTVFIPASVAEGKINVNLNINAKLGSEIIGKQNVAFSKTEVIEHFVDVLDYSSSSYRKWKIIAEVDAPDKIFLYDIKFGSYSANNNIIVSPISEIDKQKQEIWFNLNKVSDTYSVSLQALTAELNDGATTTLPKELLFTSVDLPVTFDITSSDGSTTQTWKIGVKVKIVSSETELTDFDLLSTSFDWTKIHIEPKKKRLVVEVDSDGNISFTPIFKVSDGATVLSSPQTIFNNSASTADVNTEYKITVLAGDNVSRSEWTLIFMYAPQLGDRHFNANSVVDREKYWATANLTSPITLTGTKWIERPAETNAVECSTQEQNAMIFGKLIAAGALFKGHFEMLFELNAIIYPRTMTKFGIPFNATTEPVSYNIDAKYLAGPRMQQAIATNNVYSITDVAGVDAGHIWMEMLNYTGTNIADVPNSYAGDGKNGIGQVAEGVKVVSRAELVIDEQKQHLFKDWANAVEVMFKKTNNLPITHIAFVVSSSYKGDVYLGAIGSKISVDNIRINYYIPEDGSTTKTNK